MKIVFVSHPIAGDVETNLKKVEELCASLHAARLYPIAPYHLMLQYSKDENPDERNLGIRCNLLYLEKRFVTDVFLFGDRISPGMWEEIKCAWEHGIPVTPMTPGTVRDLIAYQENCEVDYRGADSD